MKIFKSAFSIKNMSTFVPKKTYLKLKFACLEHEKPYKFLTLKYYLSCNVAPWYGLWCFHCTLLVFSRQWGWLASCILTKRHILLWLVASQELWLVGFKELWLAHFDWNFAIHINQRHPETNHNTLILFHPPRWTTLSPKHF